ncbi:O-antigen ligase family protein [Paracoccus sphaerophysae]|uniref:O-antigen ligase-related domain-containing protein n=1 Tax=Paracoccus sphaerophysae TaxID=690417 RepID=A0A099FH79_9RHOB|nr:O-antigen ligase family protein [Paracoccus sphaerophysae]KGJ09523.1 hypothetical protein IC63_01820 [Paracoccus sphaerophysae]
MTPLSPAAAALPLPRPVAAGRAELMLVAAAVFVSPMNYLRASFAYVTLGDLFTVLALGAMMLGHGLPLRPFGALTRAWYGCVLMLTGGLVLGSALRGDLVSGLIVASQYLFSLLVLPMVLMQRPRAEVLLLIKVFVLGMVFVMAHGIWVIEFDPGDARFVTPSGRLATLVERENAAASLAALAITFALWLYFIRELGIVLLLCLLAPLGYGLLLTGSNTGFFLTAIGVVALVALSGSGRIMLGMLAMLAGLAFVILGWGELFLPDIFLKRVFGALSTGNMDEAGTFSDRMFLIREAYDLTRHTIIVGLGADQYRLISAHGAPVHNTYLLLLAEGGLLSLTGHVGLIILGLMMGWAAMVSRRGRWFGVLTVTIVVLLALVQNGLAHFYARFWAVPWCLALAASLQADADPVPPAA